MTSFALSVAGVLASWVGGIVVVVVIQSSMRVSVCCPCSWLVRLSGIFAGTPTLDEKEDTGVRWIGRVGGEGLRVDGRARESRTTKIARHCKLSCALVLGQVAFRKKIAWFLRGGRVFVEFLACSLLGRCLFSLGRCVCFFFVSCGPKASLRFFAEALAQVCHDQA